MEQNYGEKLFCFLGICIYKNNTHLHVWSNHLFMSDVTYFYSTYIFYLLMQFVLVSVHVLCWKLLNKKMKFYIPLQINLRFGKYMLITRNWNSLPLIGPQSCISARNLFLQVGIELIQLYGKSREAVIQFIVLGHSTWSEHVFFKCKDNNEKIKHSICQQYYQLVTFNGV